MTCVLRWLLKPGIVAQNLYSIAAGDDEPSDISNCDANSVTDDCLKPSQEVELPKSFEFPQEKVCLLYSI